jgi:hypothetical protein
MSHKRKPRSTRTRYFCLRMSRRLAALVVLAAEVGLASIAVAPKHYDKNSSAQTLALAPANPEDFSIDYSDLLSTVGRLLPYSVIPGGVESARELDDAVHNDPVVAQHYSGFDAANSRIISLNRERAVYVSYRMGDQVFWTNRRLLLRRGETLITDGANEARTRCGNRISDTLQAPVSSNQPVLEALERYPAIGPLDTSNLPFDTALISPAPLSLPATTDTERGFFMTPSGPFAPAPGSASIIGSLPAAPVVTPEPSTVLLFSAGLSGWLLVRRFQRGKLRPSSFAPAC